MNERKLEDIKNIALKLDKIHSQSPEDYFYLKGWIDCLSQKETITNREIYKAIG